MAGLALNVGGFGSAGSGTGGMLPAAANPPSSNISQRAFGITAGQAGSKVPAYGSVGLGLLGASVLLWLWYSLPR